jgi:hypothetical protein
MTIEQKLIDQFGFNDTDGSYLHHLTRVKSAYAVGTVSLDDFEEITQDDEWYQELKKLFIDSIQEAQELGRAQGREEVASEVFECPYTINPKTCPNGDESRALEAPEQVVGTIHMSLARYQKITTIVTPQAEQKRSKE